MAKKAQKANKKGKSKYKKKQNDNIKCVAQTCNNEDSFESDDDLECLAEKTLQKVKKGSVSSFIDRLPSLRNDDSPIHEEMLHGDSDCEESTEISKVTSEEDKGNFNKLSSSLDPGEEYSNTYLNTDVMRNPGQKTKKLVELNLTDNKHTKLLQKSVIPAGVEKQFTMPEYEQSLNQQRKHRKAERERTKGKGWYGMMAQEMTDEKKNDMMVLQMRRALDPKRFYKAPDMKGLPKYFEMGTVVEMAADFYSGRVPKKQRKKTLVDELLADAEFRKYNKRKYTEIQESKMRKTGAYKRMKRLKKKKK